MTEHRTTNREKNSQDWKQENILYVNEDAKLA